MPGGHRHGVDHGVCFHVDDKLRTVLWGWAAQPVHSDDVPAVEHLMDELTARSGALVEELAGLLAADELAALTARTAHLLARRTMPLPSGAWPAIPWPAF